MKISVRQIFMRKMRQNVSLIELDVIRVIIFSAFSTIQIPYVCNAIIQILQKKLSFDTKIWLKKGSFLKKRIPLSFINYMGNFQTCMRKFSSKFSFKKFFSKYKICHKDISGQVYSK